MFCGGAAATGGATYDGAAITCGAAYDTGAAIAVVATPARATGAPKPAVPNIAMIAERWLGQEGWLTVNR